MTILRTNIGQRENARSERFEPTGAITQTNVQKAVEQVSTQAPVVSGTTVTNAQSPYTVLLSDSVLFVDCSSGAVEIDLATSASRAGKALEILDVKGTAATHNITIKPNGGEDADGYTNGSPLVISDNYGGVKLYPRSGGGGYKIAA